MPSCRSSSPTAGPREVALAPRPGGRPLRCGTAARTSRTGDLVLPAGTRLGPGPPRARGGGQRRRAVRCTRGRAWSSSRPATSSSRPGSVLEHGQIVDSNHVDAAAPLVEAAGAEVGRVGAPARRRRRRCARCSTTSRARPTSSSRPAGSRWGSTTRSRRCCTADGGVEFVKVAMRPGMPQGCGVVGRVAHARRSPCPATRSARSSRSTCSCCPRCGGSPGSTRTPTAPSRPSPTSGVGRRARARSSCTRVVETAGRVRPSGGPGLARARRASPAATALAVVPADVERVERRRPGALPPPPGAGSRPWPLTPRPRRPPA